MHPSTTNAGRDDSDAAINYLLDQLRVLYKQEAQLLITDPIGALECQRKREEVQEKYDQLLREKSIKIRLEGRDQFGKALLGLNFRTQVKGFKQSVLQPVPARSSVLVASSDAATGYTYNASHLLLKRLLHQVPGSTTISPIVLSLGRKSRRGDVDAIWRELAKQTGAEYGAQPSDIARLITERLRYQHVIIVLRDLDRVDPDDCVRMVWSELEDRARGTSSPYLLLFFLVDDKGTVDLGAFRAGIKKHKDVTCLVLPPISQFTKADLDRWLNSSIDDAPVGFPGQNLKALAKSVHGESEGGMPDMVLTLLCGLWKLADWELEEWLQA